MSRESRFTGKNQDGGHGGSIDAQGGSDNTGGIDLTGSGGAPPTGCTPGNDADGDGFTEAEGDCNDCDPNVNPGAIEVMTDPNDPNAVEFDENCDGNIDEIAPTCDMGFAYNDVDAFNGARALELCTMATPGGKDYGVLDARWVKANGQSLTPTQAAQFGIHPNFGSNVLPQMGERMLVLSSGAARLPGQPGANTGQSQDFADGVPPPGFPQNVPGCEGSTEINDDVGLELRLRAPTNATGYSFLFKFYSFEFAEYVCTQFNDQFVALVDPAPPGSINGNISFDSNNNPVSVNIAYFDSCDPVANNDFALFCLLGCPPPPNPYCPAGPADLVGNGFLDAFGSGFEDGGATAWLQTTAPVNGGEEFTIRFAIWDTEDNAWDSTVLIDGFQWTAEPGTQVGTEPPK